ncbi:hypothetical protein B4Q13_24735, partial [Lacticaseibacillus rhamnosus]
KDSTVVADIYDFPMQDSVMDLSLDSAFDVIKTKNGGVVTKSMFLSNYDRLHAQLGLEDMVRLFKDIDVAGLQCYGIALTFSHSQMTTHIGLFVGGNISETHARAARAIPDVEIAAIFGTNAQKLDRLCREYGGKPFSNFDEFLAHRPMQLVAIGSPSGLHAEQGIAAARHGL